MAAFEMNKHKSQRSLASRFSMFTAAIIFLQSVLLTGTLMAGGVIKQSRENMYLSFREKVMNQTRYIQSEIDNRWTNIAPYVKDISTNISQEGIFSSQQALEEFLFEASDTLINMLRVTGTTGSFLILREELAEGDNHAGLYFRDYDPKANYDSNNDLYLAIGPSSVSRRLQIPLDRTWQYNMDINEENGDFFWNPYEASSLTRDYTKIGYWSLPFRPSPLDNSVITYSVPVFDENGVVYGVMGVEISIEYIKKLLPSSELMSYDSLGYIIAVREENSSSYEPLLYQGGYQERILKDIEDLQFKLKNQQYQIFEFINTNAGKKIYSCIEPLTLYNFNAPYHKDTWVVIGLAEEDALFAFVKRLQNIFVFSFVCSLILGIIAGSLFSRRITAPIVNLAEKVRSYDYTKRITIEKTGLTEIDDLTSAIETTNKNLLDSTLRMSQIMDLVNVQIGAFEFKNKSCQVFVTNQIFDLLQIKQTDPDSLYISRQVFLDRLQEIWTCLEPYEKDVFLVHQEPKRWIKIEMMNQGDECLGVVSDVTDEMREKHRIREERDFDDLTKLYNRAAFRRNLTDLLKQKNLGVAALVMFDMDGLKNINDTYGHEYGDLYIIEAAKQLSKMCPDKTIVGRRSGDEFYVFFYGYSSKKEIQQEIKRFYNNLKKEPMMFPNGNQFYLQVSSGISWYQEDAFNYEELIRHSDFAMYEVKHTSKGRLGEFDQNRYQKE